ncbi:MAG: glycosyltransferase [Thermodesulfobacteriota bacterium]
MPHLDPYSWWLKAQKPMVTLFEQYMFSAIWATAPMALPHALAHWASKKWGVPWIADFRDIYGEFNRDYIGDRLKYPIRLIQEMRYLKNASAIVTVSEGLAEVMTKRHGRKVHVIPNGYDPDSVLEDGQGTSKHPKFNITYTGALLLPQRNPVPVLDALKQLSEAGQIDLNDVSVDFYGVPREVIEKVMNGHACKHIIRVFSRVSAEECINVQRSSAILLQLAHSEERGIMTGKIFEYLAARRPIISVPKDGDCVDGLLKETNAGVSCTTVDEIAKQLYVWYLEWKRTGNIEQHVNKGAMLKYSRREQTKQLAYLLNQIVADR